MEYILHIMIMICIYTILSQSLSLVAGYSGQMSLAHAGFYGIGAYVTAILSVDYHIAVHYTILISLFITAMLAYIVSKVAIRTVDDYYVIITLGVQVVIYSVMNNYQELTRGPLGINNIPPINVIGLVIDDKYSFVFLSILVTIIIWYILKNITSSPFGRVLQAISEDEIYTKSLGKNVESAKIMAFVLSGMFASIAGVIYAHYVGYIDPKSFTVEESVYILSIVIIGGMRSLSGIFITTVLLMILPEVLRFIGMPTSVAANVRQIIYGVALIIVVYEKKEYFKKFQKRK